MRVRGRGGGTGNGRGTRDGEESGQLKNGVAVLKLPAWSQ